MASMDTLAVFGWRDGLPRLLSRLERHASLRAVAVGDQQATRLLRARSETGLPCYQHLLEMARATDYDAAYIDASALAGEIAELAASRGADLVVNGDDMDGEAMAAAATAAVRHGVALAVLRPAFLSAGYAFLSGLAASDSRWHPGFVSLEMRGDRPVSTLMRDAVAAAIRLSSEEPLEVTASAGGSGEEPDVALAHLRFPDGSLASLTARMSPEESLRLSLTAPGGDAELVSEGSETVLSIAVGGGPPESSRLPHGDLDMLEATRVAAVRRGEVVDTLFAHREAAIVHALEQSLNSGRVAAVRSPTTRAALRVLKGGVAAPTPRAGQLHLVGS